MKILITGGHLTPALSVIEEIEKRFGEKSQILYAGRKYAFENENIQSREYKIITGKNISFYSIFTGKLSRQEILKTLASLWKIPIGLFQSFKLLKSLKPDVVLSFGGYLALPVCLAAKILSVPIITHEQTFTQGLSNKIISFLADKVCVSWPETLTFFPKSKTILTGNPIRNSVFQINKNLVDNLKKEDKLLYITGGGLGSHAINEVIKSVLPDLLARYVVIHQCGESQTYNDYGNLSLIKDKLPEGIKKRYLLKKFTEEDEIGWVLNKSYIIIGRSGANTVAEILALGKVALLIPLPWSGENEQIKNALYLEKLGLAKIIYQKNFNDKTLLENLDEMENNYSKYHKSAIHNMKQNLNASEEIVKIIYETVSKPKT